MKKVLLLGALAGLLAAGCASTSRNAEIREKKAEIYFTAGTEALMDKKFTEALAALIEAAQLNPNSAATWTNLGLAYLGKNEAQKAEDSFKKAISVDPKWTDARSNLGALYLRQKRYKEAEAQLKEVLQDLVYSRAYQAHYNLALVYLSNKKPLQGESHLKLALETAPDYCPAWLRLGMIQKERGEFEKAAESLSKAVYGTCYNNPEAHYEISSLLLKARETGRAKSKLLEIIQLFPQSDWARKAEVTLNLIR